MINIVPTKPLGPYPQDRLCGQTGIIPRRTSIKMTSKIVPIDISLPSVKSCEIRMNGLQTK